MATLTIQCQSSTCTNCAICGKSSKPVGGPRLYVGDSDEWVCRECGQRHAPQLAALLDLACVAERVARIGRHTLVPSMAVLLELARAAETYAENRPTPIRQAA